MRDLPAGWAWATLQDLAAAEPRAITDGPFGSNLKSSHYVNSGPRVVRLQNIGFGEFVDEKAHITEQHFETLRIHEARAGDLLVASLGQDMPRACLVPAGVGRAVVKADCIRVRLHPNLDARFVNYALQRPELRDAVAGRIHGVGRPRLGMVGIKALSVPLAPRREQERIVAAIEEHLSRLDAAEGNVLSTERRLAQFASAAASARSIWPRVAIGEIADVFVGTTPKRSEAQLWGGPVSWVSSGEVAFCRIVKTRETISDDAVRPDRIHPPGTVLMAMIGEGKTRGQVAILDIPAAHNQNSAAIRPNLEVVSSEWLYQTLKDDYLANRRVGSGNNQPALNKARVSALTIPLPPLSEQRKLLDEHDRAEVVIDRLLGALRTTRARSASLRRLILASAFAGQLVPQDPHDEPASVMLKGIRAQRGGGDSDPASLNRSAAVKASVRAAQAARLEPLGWKRSSQ